MHKHVYNRGTASLLSTFPAVACRFTLCQASVCIVNASLARDGGDVVVVAGSARMDRKGDDAAGVVEEQNSAELVVAVTNATITVLV